MKAINSPYAKLLEQAPKINVYKWFLVFAIIHIVVWTLVPYFFRAVLPADTIEGLTWGNLWLWGYAKHPFLAPWLTSGASIVTGGTIGWPQYLVSQMSVVVCFWAVWR